MSKKVVVAFMLVGLLLLPVPTVQAQSSGWGALFDENGALLPGVVDLGKVYQDVDWMDAGLFGHDILDASFHQYLLPSGELVVMPSSSTLFFMVLHPDESGLHGAQMLANGFGWGLTAPGILLSLMQGTSSWDNIWQSAQNMGFVDPEQFADALISGQTNIWTLGGPDVMNMIRQLSGDSWEDIAAYNAFLIYSPSNCGASPTGCPAAQVCADMPEIAFCQQICAIEPGFCPNPPSGDISCPLPYAEPGAITEGASSSFPVYPVVIGQDTEGGGAQIMMSASVAPTALHLFTPVYEEDERCLPAPSGATLNCKRGEISTVNDGTLQNVLVLTGCEEEIVMLPEAITVSGSSANLTGESQDWIVNDLGSAWYGARVYQGQFSLTGYAYGGGQTAGISTPVIPFRDPGSWVVRTTYETSGTYYEGQQVTAPRMFVSEYPFRMYVTLPSLIP